MATFHSPSAARPIAHVPEVPDRLTHDLATGRQGSACALPASAAIVAATSARHPCAINPCKTSLPAVRRLRTVSAPLMTVNPTPHVFDTPCHRTVPNVCRLCATDPNPARTVAPCRPQPERSPHGPRPPPRDRRVDPARCLGRLRRPRRGCRRHRPARPLAQPALHPRAAPGRPPRPEVRRHDRRHRPRRPVRGPPPPRGRGARVRGRPRGPLAPAAPAGGAAGGGARPGHPTRAVPG